jgi:hypothetical protein
MQSAIPQPMKLTTTPLPVVSLKHPEGVTISSNFIWIFPFAFLIIYWLIFQ